MPHKITPIRVMHSLDRCALFFYLDKPITRKKGASIAHSLMGYAEGLFKKTGEPTKELNAELFFYRDNPEKFDWHALIRKQAIGIVCAKYTRWDEFYHFAENIIDRICTEVPKHSALTMSLSVIDVFNVQIEGDFPLTDLFRHNSSYIAPAFLNAQIPPSISSCTTSALIEKIKPWVIHNKKIEISANASHKNGEIIFKVDDLQSFLATGKERLNFVAPDVCESIKRSAYYLHQSNKQTIADVLNDSVLERIGLKEGGEK